MALNLKKTEEAYNSSRANRSSIGGDRWKPKENESSVIRLIPHTMEYFDGEVVDIGFLYLVHYNVGPEGAQTVVTCPRTYDVAGDPEKGVVPVRHRCPICEKVAELRKGDEQQKSRASELGARRRYLMNILDMNAVDKGVQAYECGATVRDGIFAYCNQKYGDPMDITAGRNFTLTCVVPNGNKRKTDYKIMPDLTQTSVKKILPQNWKEQIAKLKNMLPKAYSYEQIKGIMLGSAEQEKTIQEVKEATEVQQQAPLYQPTPQQQPMQQQSVPQSQPVQQANVPVSTDVPPCFGEEYSTVATSKCQQSCSHNVACKAKYLS